MKEAEAINGEWVIKIERWLLGKFPHLSQMPYVCESEGPPRMGGCHSPHQVRYSLTIGVCWYFTTIFKRTELLPGAEIDGCVPWGQC